MNERKVNDFIEALNKNVETEMNRTFANVTNRAMACVAFSRALNKTLEEEKKNEFSH